MADPPQGLVSMDLGGSYPGTLAKCDSRGLTLQIYLWLCASPVLRAEKCPRGRHNTHTYKNGMHFICFCTGR